MGDRKALPLLDERVQTNAKLSDWLDKFDTVLTDCDGVLWLDDQALEGAAQTINRLRQLGKKIFYVTNNSTKTQAEFTCKAERLGFIAHKDEIISTAYLVATYLKQRGFSGKCYVVGSKGLTKELELAGIEHFGVGPDPHTAGSLGELVGSLKLDPEVKAVVVGFDEHFSYPKMLKAASYLGQQGCTFLATNTDERFPIADRGVVVPGTGSIVRAIETAAGQQAVCLGKPNEYMCKLLVESSGLDPERTLMIGDRCNTDILLGTRCGFHTLLVLTGVTQMCHLRDWKASALPEDKDLLPDFYLNKLGDLLPYI